MFSEILIQAIDSIKSNKMRTFLTMLGVVIGVSAVIMIFSAGNAGKAYINGMFNKLGSNAISVAISDTANADDTDYFTFEDAEFVYDGTAKTPTVTVKDGSTTLTSGTDYTVSYASNTNVGTATATITGANVYNSTTKAYYNESIDAEPANIAGKKFTKWTLKTCWPLYPEFYPTVTASGSR